MGFFDIFNANKRKWIAIQGNSDTPDNLIVIIHLFYLKDNIDYAKYLGNEAALSILKGWSVDSIEAWEKTENFSIYADSLERKVNCTPTFRNYNSENRYSPARGIPDWFYIAYPDVFEWLQNDIPNKKFGALLENSSSEYMSNGYPNVTFFRLVIDEFKYKNGKLECEV